MRSELTELGIALRKWRKSRKMLLKEMSENIGCSSAHLSSVEYGLEALTKDQFKKLYELICDDPLLSDFGIAEMIRRNLIA